MNETRQTVLVVDDTPVNIDLLSEILAYTERRFASDRPDGSVA